MNLQKKLHPDFHTSICGRIARGYASFVITGTVDRLEFLGGQIQIGKLKFHIDYWLNNYRTLLEGLGYDPKQIDEYEQYILFCGEKHASVMGKVNVN